jgi:hypothetical protein
MAHEHQGRQINRIIARGNLGQKILIDGITLPMTSS